MPFGLHLFVLRRCCRCHKTARQYVKRATMCMLPSPPGSKLDCVQESDTIERFIHLRRLQSEPIYVIKDEQSLLDAIVRGRRRIEIRTHLDLTTINAQDEAGVLQMLGNNDLVGSDSGINITVSMLYQTFCWANTMTRPRPLLSPSGYVRHKLYAYFL